MSEFATTPETEALKRSRGRPPKHSSGSMSASDRQAMYRRRHQSDDAVARNHLADFVCEILATLPEARAFARNEGYWSQRTAATMERGMALLAGKEQVQRIRAAMGGTLLSRSEIAKTELRDE